MPKFIKTCFHILKYLYEVIRGLRDWARMFELAGMGQGKPALVVGNGPSQGYLTAAILQSFLDDGGAIFGVNYWHLNELIAAVPPTYLVISDPVILSNSKINDDIDSKNLSLIDYINKNKKTQIICPIHRCKELKEKFGTSRILGFIDTPLNLPFYTATAPILPRSYCSMTLYKALAVASWMDYSSIYVIGMDNTYLRKLYSDINSRILFLSDYVTGKEFICDESERYQCVGDCLVSLSESFYSAMRFSVNKNIVNIDEFSLTDAFPKVKFDQTFKKYIKD